MNQNIFDTSQILERIQKTYGLKSDSDVARFLGVSRGVVSGWKGRNTFDWELLFEKCGQEDLNWLIFGKEPENTGTPFTRQDLARELGRLRGTLEGELKIQLAGLWRGVKGLHERAHGPLGPEADRSPTGEPLP